GGVHLRGIAEAQDAAQVLLAHGGPDLTGRRPYDRGGLAREGVLAVRPARPINRVLQRAGNRPVVLGRDEEHRVDRRDALLELARRRWEIPVVVVAVEG